MIFVISFVLYAIWLFVSMFLKEEFFLKVESNNLSYDFGTYFDNHGYFVKSDYCDDKFCVKMTNEDFINAYFYSEPEYCVVFPKIYWSSEMCENLTVDF